MNGLRLFAAVAMVSLCSLWAPAEETPAAATKQEWTVKEVLLEESAVDFEVSPDGRWAVWVKRQMDKEKGKRVSNLWLSSLIEQKSIQLTRGKYSHADPKWSPDGTLISFLSTRPLPEAKRKEKRASQQLWLMNAAGGEPWPVTAFAAGADTHFWESESPIVAYAWKDEDAVVLAAREGATLYEQQRQERKDTSQAVEDAAHESPVRLLLLSVKDRKLRRLTDNRDWIDLLSVSPDGRWAATSHQRSLSFEFDHKITPALYLTNLETGEQQAVAADRRLYPDRLEWARDSSGFYFAAEYSTHPVYFTATITRLYFYELATRQLHEVDLEWEKGLANQGAGLRAIPGGFLALLADGVRYQPARYTKQGTTWRRSRLDGTHANNIFKWVASQDGQRLIYEHSTASQPTQWYGAKLNGTSLMGEQQVTHLNPSFAHKPIARTEIVRWTGAQDETVEGVLYYPNEYEPGKRYPLILMIHGGPTGVDLDAWFMATSRPIPLFTQRNAFVLRVNYHGSGNYGLAWAESIGGGKYYELERVDLENGVDAMIERGLADPDRLGVMGWSNGAILTTELITRSRRYKAASAGAGDVEWISDWGNVDFGASFDNYYFGAAPYEDPDLYVQKSPFFRLKDVTTPTIIYTGTEDRNVPPSQSWSHFRVMQQATETPVRFILFPGEPHGLKKFVHQRRKVEEDLAWFDRYLFHTYKEPNEALKEGSPLDMALKRSRFSRVGTRYGMEANGTMIPEVVQFKGLALGRFEVTRAQYAAFDPDYRFEAETENYPANGISFDSAQAYVEWLADLTGEDYRLPTQDEAQALTDGSDVQENTLDHWAGYPLNPDDADRLRAKVRELPGAAALLREVGSFPGRGKEEPAFDLGGNVAEWVVGKDGGGELAGGSADQPADPKSEAEAGEAYRGFRIVHGTPKETTARVN